MKAPRMTMTQERIGPDPFYPNDSTKQNRLEQSIKMGFIDRQRFDNGTANYILTPLGIARWVAEIAMEKMKDEN